MDGRWRSRGWYIRGKGIEGPDGTRRRALVISSGGGGDRIAAIDDPSDIHYTASKDGTTHPNDDWPSDHSGFKSMLHWRALYTNLHETGYAVIAADCRGTAHSGGSSPNKTPPQGRHRH